MPYTKSRVRKGHTRPPKKWFNRTLKSISRKRDITHPEALTAWKWKKKSAKEKIKILRKEGKLIEGSNTMKVKKGSAKAKAVMAKLRALRRTGRSVIKRAKASWTRLSRKQKFFFSGKRKSQRSLYTVSHKLEPLIIKEGTMGKRRKSRKRKCGFEGRKRRSSRRRYSGELLGRKRRRSGRRYHGASARINPVAIMTQVAGLGVGAIAGSAVAKFVPIPAKFKGAVPIALGVILPILKLRGKIMEDIATGSIAVGVISLLRNFLPAQIPLLAGAATAEEVLKGIENLPAEEQAMLGYEGEEDVDGSISPASAIQSSLDNV